MKKQKQIASVLLLAMLSVTALQGCGEQAVTPTTEEATSEDTTTEAVETDALTGSGLAVKDWGGKTFNVMTSKPENDSFRNFEVYAESENGDILNDAIYRRNRALEELLNVSITETVITTEKTTTAIQESVLADDRIYDLAFARQYEVGALALDGFLYNMKKLDDTDYTQSWWDKLILESAEINGNLFFASSAFDLHAKKRTYINIYNVDLAEKYHIGNISDLVRAGTWTIDKQTEYCRMVANDLNGDQKMALEDQYGLLAGDLKDLQYYFIASGGMIARKDSKGQISLTLNNERTIQIIDKWIKLMDKSTSAIPNHFESITSNPYDDTYEIFTSGRALFNDCTLNGATMASKDVTFNYKVVPLPKLDEAQETYYTMTDNIGMLFCVPANVPDPSFTGYMLEALSYVSSSTTLPTYYEKCCKIKSVYDEDSAEMIDLAMSGQVCDVGFLYDIGGLAKILNKYIPQDLTNSFASYYASMEETAKENISEIYKKLDALS